MRKIYLLVFIAALSLTLLLSFASRGRLGTVGYVMPARVVLESYSDGPDICDALYSRPMIERRGLPFVVFESMRWDWCAIYYQPNNFRYFYPLSLVLNMVVASVLVVGSVYVGRKVTRRGRNER